jgi:DNA polymerase-3 subunit epsilon
VSLFDRWRRRLPTSDLALAARHDWSRLTPIRGSAALDSVRYVMVDTETGGLDPKRDRLIAIGACAVAAGALRVGESFAALLRQEQPSAVANVLIHGIGHGAQAAGQPPAEALAAYLRFARRDTLVGYHAPFDLLVVQRAVRDALGIAYRPACLDLALLLPALEAQPDSARWELDRWLARFRLRAFERHNALADAAATGELFLIALHKARARGLHTLGELLKLQKQQGKLVRMGHT